MLGEFHGFETRHGVQLDGERSDVHVRLDHTMPRHPIAWCAVYVRPEGPRPGYWHFPTGKAAVTVAVRAGIRVAS